MAHQIGIVGFGCVAQGFYDIINGSPSVASKLAVKKICIKHGDKPRSIDDVVFTTDIHDLLNDAEIGIIVELIDDAEAALKIVTAALSQGKVVVTANKKMVAENLPELIQLQVENQCRIYYEAAVCASIPLLKTLDQHYRCEPITAVEGIVNGSTNYILSKMFDEELAFDEALNQAQQLGYAETNPQLDIEAFDSAYKLCIIIYHAFNTVCKPRDILKIGIETISPCDIEFAIRNNKVIKLTSCCWNQDQNIRSVCIPRFVSVNQHLGRVEDACNAVEISSANTDKQLLIGKGAGGAATGMAVLADVVAAVEGGPTRTTDFKSKGAVHDDGFSLNIYARYKRPIDLSAFEEVLQQENINGDKYAIGKISARQLKHADWVSRADTSVVMID